MVAKARAGRKEAVERQRSPDRVSRPIRPGYDCILVPIASVISALFLSIAVEPRRLRFARSTGGRRRHHVVSDDDLNGYLCSTMGTLLLGGAIALVGTLFVQILVVPWINRRNRRLDKWEEDVLALGSLLAREIGASRREITRSWEAWRAFRFKDPNWSPEDENGQFWYEEQSPRTRVGEAVHDYAERVSTEVTWLCRRVASRGNFSDRDLLQRLRAVSETLPPPPRSREGEANLAELQREVEAWGSGWEKNQTALNRLVDAVNPLADQIVAPAAVGPIRQARQRLSRKTEQREGSHEAARVESGQQSAERTPRV